MKFEYQSLELFIFIFKRRVVTDKVAHFTLQTVHVFFLLPPAIVGSFSVLHHSYTLLVKSIHLQLVVCQSRLGKPLVADFTRFTRIVNMKVRLPF